MDLIRFVMATSSSDESITAPKDFHLSSSLDSGSRNSPKREKCLLCSKSKNIFYCKECIHNGDFYASKSNYTERYADKQIRLLELKTATKLYEGKCQEVLVKKQNVDKLSSQIRQSKDRIITLKLALEEKREQQVNRKEKLAKLIKDNEKLSIKLPNYEGKVEEIKTFVEGRQCTLNSARKRLKKDQLRLKHLRRNRVQQLTQYIFPITIVQPKSEVETSTLALVSELAEASRTTYISDHWVYTDSSGELQHCIVAPSLPSSGNYSAYNICVAQNKDVPTPGATKLSVAHNAAYNISAALTYTAQLVNVLAFYLDVRLPYKMNYSDFCSSEMEEEQFSRRVARLNANVLYLCFTQNTQVDRLHPFRALYNILQMLDPQVSDLGREGPMEVNAQIAKNLEEQLSSELKPSEDSDLDEGDSLPQEWEAVSTDDEWEVIASNMDDEWDVIDFSI